MFEKIFKKPWPYMIGAVILAVLNTVLLKTTGAPWKVTSGFLYLGAWVLELIGLDPSKWYYFSIVSEGDLFNGESFINNSYIVINSAVIIGVLLATLWASEFKIKKIKSKKQLFFGLVGGILMGYGSRLSFGCNIGSYFSAIPSFSLHGWVFALFMFVGAWIGSKILIKYLL